jgi:hypothetical protein
VEDALAGQMATEGRAIGEMRTLRGEIEARRGLEPGDVVRRVDDAIAELEGAKAHGDRIARIVTQLEALAEPAPSTAAAPRGAPGGGPRPPSGFDTADR